MINLLALFTSIAIAGVAAWYSIIGLMAIFAASAIPIAIMGGVLEVGKLVTASWLYQNWRETPLFLKSYLTGAVAVLMFVTSMGIFGFLSKAHIEQTIVSGDKSLQISLIEGKIERQQRRISDAETVIKQLDTTVQTLIEYDRIRGEDGALATRQSQRGERDQLERSIGNAAEKIGALQEEKLVLEKEQLGIEAEVGPIKYIAALVYDETNKANLEESVRWVIIIIISVFDPLAVLLLIAANQGLTNNRKADIIKTESKKSFFQRFEEAIGMNQDEGKDVANYKNIKKKILPSDKVEIDKQNIAKF
jgi:hypothetical protein